MDKVIRLRYPATCASCGAAMTKGAVARWNQDEKRATCVACVEPGPAEEPIDRGVAGGSAAREWQRRHDRRENEVRARYGKLGGLALALSDEVTFDESVGLRLRVPSELRALTTDRVTRGP